MNFKDIGIEEWLDRECSSLRETTHNHTSTFGDLSQLQCDSYDSQLPRYEVNSEISREIPQCILHVVIPSSTFSLACMGSRVQRERLIEHTEFEAIINIERDPETLDDSDIDNYLFTQERECKDFGGTMNKNKVKFESTYLIASKYSLHFAGHTESISFEEPISDINVLRVNEYEPSYIFVASETGYLYCVVVHDLENIRCTFLKIWYLGGTNLSKFPWKIIVPKLEYTRTFGVFNSSSCLVKLFHWQQPYTFKLSRNLKMNANSLTSCEFFPSRIDNSQSLIFVSGLKAYGTTYFCVTWNYQSPDLDQIYQINEVLHRDIVATMPIGENKILALTPINNFFISSNQIISGEADFEIASNEKLDLPKFSFPSYDLLKKFQLIDEEVFKNYVNCYVTVNSINEICALFCTTNNQMQTFGLTKLKDIKCVVPANSQGSIDDINYRLIVLTGGKTLELIINLIEVYENATHPNIIPLHHGISMKRTLDCSSDDFDDFILIPSVFNPFHQLNKTEELLLSSKARISRARTKIPVSKISDIIEFDEYQLYEKVQVIDFPQSGFDISKHFNIDIGANNKIILVSNSLISKTYEFDFSQDYPKVTELKDFLPKHDSETIDIFFTTKNLVQITPVCVYVEMFSGEASLGKKDFDIPQSIDKCIHSGSQILVWNSVTHNSYFIENIDDMKMGDSFKEYMITEDSVPKDLYQYSSFITATDKKQELELILVKHGEFASICWKEDNPSKNVTKLSKFDALQKLFSSHDGRYITGELMIEDMISESNKLSRYENSILRSSRLYIRNYRKNRCFWFQNNRFGILRTGNLVNLSDVLHNKIEITSKITKGINIIYDLIYDESLDRVILLTDHGLLFFKLSYLTYEIFSANIGSNNGDDEIFVFLTKLKRVLIIHKGKHEWEYMKFDTGRCVKLDSDLLQHNKFETLFFVGEVTAVGDETLIVLIYSESVKLIQLKVIDNKIVPIMLSEKNYRCRITGKVAVHNDGHFLVYCGNISNSPYYQQLERKYSKSRSVFFQIRIDTNTKEIVLSTRLLLDNSSFASDFNYCGDKLVIVDNIFDRLQVINNFASKFVITYYDYYELQGETTQVYRESITPLNDFCFMTCVNSNTTRLEFFRIDNINEEQRIPSNMIKGPPVFSVSEARLKNNYTTGFLDQEIQHKKRQTYYDCIVLENRVKAIKYAKESKNLYLLLEDKRIVLLSVNSNKFEFNNSVITRRQNNKLFSCQRQELLESNVTFTI